MAIIKNPLTIVQSGGGSVELGTYNKIGQPFVVNNVSNNIYLNTDFTREEILQLFAELPQNDIILEMPCYKICEFISGRILLAVYTEGMAACFLTNPAGTDVDALLFQISGVDYAFGELPVYVGETVKSIGSSNDILLPFISNGEFTKGDIFTAKDTISGKYEIKSLRYPDSLTDSRVDTINKEDKTIVTQITNLPVFIGGINYALATAQIEYYGMCQNAVSGEDPYEEAVVFRQTRFGGSGIVPLQGGKSLRLTKVRVLSTTFTVTFTFYYDKTASSLAPKTEQVMVPGSMQPQEVQVPVYEGANCYRIDASETD